MINYITLQGKMLPWWLSGKSTVPMQETQVRSLGGDDSPGEGNGNPLQYSCLEKSHGGGAWQATQSTGVTKSRTRLSNFTLRVRHTQCLISGHQKGL